MLTFDNLSNMQQQLTSENTLLHARHWRHRHVSSIEMLVQFPSNFQSIWLSRLCYCLFLFIELAYFNRLMENNWEQCKALEASYCVTCRIVRSLSALCSVYMVYSFLLRLFHSVGKRIPM